MSMIVSTGGGAPTGGSPMGPGPSSDVPSPDGEPFGLAIAVLPRLPEAAVDAFFESGAMDAWHPGLPAPSPVSSLQALRLAMSLPSKTMQILTRSCRDPLTLETIAKARKIPAIVAGVAQNPWLSWSDLQVLSTLLPASISPCREAPALVSADEEELDEDNLDFFPIDYTLEDKMRLFSGIDKVAPEELLDQLIRFNAAQLAASVLAGVTGTTDQKERLEAEFTNVLWGPSFVQARVFRGLVLDILEQIDLDACDELTRSIVTTHDECLDAGVFPHVERLLEDEELSTSDIEARIHSDAAALATIHESPLLSLIAEPPAPRLPLKYRETGIWKQAGYDSGTWAVLALVTDYASPMSRLRLSTSEPVGDDEISDLLVAADVETFLDWAESSLSHKPKAGQVLEEVLKADQDRLSELADEALRRPSTFTNAPDLALVLPQVITTKLEPKAARRVRMHMEQHLHDDPIRWKLASRMVDDAWGSSVLDLVDVAALAVDDDLAAMF